MLYEVRLSLCAFHNVLQVRISETYTMHICGSVRSHFQGKNSLTRKIKMSKSKVCQKSLVL